MDHSTAAATTRSPTPDDSFARVKRQLYLAYLLLVLLGSGVLWAFPPAGRDTLGGVVANAVVPPAMVFTLVCLALLWWRPTSVALVEMALYWSSYPVFIGILVTTFALADTPAGRQSAFHSFGAWLPIAVVWSFLAFGSRRGIFAAVAFVASASAALAVTSFVAPATGPLGLAFVGQLLVASTLFIVILFVFTRLLERQVAARSAAEVLAGYAFRDALTGLPNRFALETRFEQARAIVRRGGGLLAVLYLDLDDFKRVNDTFGHRGGDALLRQFAMRLTGAVRESDTVARVGGDEFVVLAFVQDPGQARILVDKLVATQAAPYVLDEAEVRLGSSIGLSLYPLDGLDAEALLSHADAAMYAAKAGGPAREAARASRAAAGGDPDGPTD